MDLTRIKESMSSRFDSCELFYLKERSKKFESKEREICGMEFKEEEGVALRALKDQKMVFAYTYDHENPHEALLKHATSLLSITERDNDRFFPPQSGDYPVLSLYDNDGLKVDDAQKTTILIDMEASIRDFDKRIVTVRNCELQEIELINKIENSNGLTVEGKKTIYVLSALCVAKDEDEVSWYDWSWAHSLNMLDAKGLGRRIAAKTISFLSGKQIDTGIYRGILAPQAACDMLGVLSESFLAESLFKKKTKLKAKEGSKCFSEAVTIIDSGNMGLDAFPFDSEGVPSKENLVVNNGYFETFLYDAYYGRKYNVRSTGNSVRSGIKDMPRCGPRGTFIRQGERDIMDGFTKGIIIEELMGTHTSNPITGDFSLGAIGHLCRGSERIPFQGVIFSGNVFELLQNVKEVGNDLKFYGVFGSPSLYIEGIKISGK